MRPAVLTAVALVFGLSILSARADEPMRFTALDNTVVRVYFQANPVVWTGLSPEQAKHFERGRPLPFGVKVSALPRSLLSRLPVRRGFAYGRIGSDVALIDNRTSVVVDVIENVFG
jgi:hypothetical protein